MNDQTKSEVRHEVQRFVASTEMFDQPEGKIELTPVAQKAIDRYLFKWIGMLGTLSTALVMLLGFVGFENLTATAKLTAQVAAQSAEKAAEEANSSLDQFEGDLKLMADKATKSVEKAATEAKSSLNEFQGDLKTSKEELGAFASETQIEHAKAREEASAIGLKLNNDRMRIDALRKELESKLDDLRSRSNAFNSELIEKRAEWDAISLVEELQGVVEKIADDDRILGFIADRMTLNAMPVGSIVGWHKNFPGAPPNPPDGWVECSGPPSREQYDWLEDSTIDLSEVPNLNDPNKPGFINGYGGGAFLRGSTRSGAFGRDSTKRPNAAFTTGSNIGAHRHGVHGGKLTGSMGGTILFGKTESPLVKDTSVAGNHGHSITGGGDPETRPVNMSVVWIIRVK